MKVPESKQALFAWPPLHGGLLIFAALTSIYVFPLYHDRLVAQQYSVFFVGYLYPSTLALLFVLRLSGRYWSGFVWAGWLSYLLAAVIAALKVLEGVFLILMVLAILFLVQGVLLYLKERLFR
jgi:uncharacterized membrane protein HdeD (DUF308 family)